MNEYVFERWIELIEDNSLNIICQDQFFFHIIKSDTYNPEGLICLAALKDGIVEIRTNKSNVYGKITEYGSDRIYNGVYLPNLVRDWAKIKGLTVYVKIQEAWFPLSQALKINNIDSREKLKEFLLNNRENLS